MRTSLYKVEKLSKLKKIIMENENDSNMAAPIILPSLLLGLFDLLKQTRN